MENSLLNRVSRFSLATSSACLQFASSISHATIMDAMAPHEILVQIENALSIFSTKKAKIVMITAMSNKTR